jgi:RNA polymerase sigma-70 factor (ECF subfamily)
MPAVTVSKPGGKTIRPDFEEIYQEYAPMVYRTAKGVLGNSQDAEDVLQTIFLRLLRRDLPPDLKQNPRAYLYRAAVNLSLDTIEARRRHVLTDQADRLGVSAPADNSHPEEELHKRLYEAIAQLGPEAAEILILRYVHNTSDAEIAKMLGTSRGVIAVRLFRSRARLKKLLGSPLGEES